MSKFFDEAVFHLLGAELGEADAIEVLGAFLADTADKMERLAATGEDRARTTREAHSIKSSAATFGFADLSRLAKELESSAETMTPAKLQESIGALRRSFETARQFAQANLLDTSPRTGT
jgi:HPt (histidine-containing phosphotransfer) domain-containing protein